jgi:hypothetical protein
MTLFHERLKRAKVHKIHSVNRVEVILDLGFGVQKRHVFKLEGVNPRRDIPPNKRTPATNCLVRLLGGKRVLVQPESESPDASVARIYFMEKIYGNPIGMVQHVPSIDRPILDVTLFLLSLAPRGFQVDEVRQVTNASRSKD